MYTSKHMQDASPPSKDEKHLLNSSVGFIIAAVICIIILIMGTLFSGGSEESGFGGMMMFAVILIVPFIIISCIYSVALIRKATSRKRRTYAITATIITSLLGLGCLVALILSSLRG